MEYVARSPTPSLESIVDDLDYLAGTPPYPRLTIPPMPSALVIINLAAPFRVTHPGGREDFADGCVWATPTCRTAVEHPRNTRSVGIHLKPCGLEPVKRETYPNGVRKALFRDPDGNEIGFGGAPL